MVHDSSTRTRSSTSSTSTTTPKNAVIAGSRHTLRLPDIGALRSRLAAKDHVALDRIAHRLSSLDESGLQAFANLPLAVLDAHAYVMEVPRPEGEPQVSLEVPFNVAKHPDAQAAAAKRVTARLTEDMKNYEDRVNAATTFVFSVDLLSDEVPLSDKVALVNSCPQPCSLSSAYPDLPPRQYNPLLLHNA